MAKTALLFLASAIFISLASAGPLHHLQNTNIYSWGNNQHGQLGNGERSEHQFAQRVKIPNLIPTDVTPNFTKIMASRTHVLASTSDGLLYGWGSNCDGALERSNYTTWRAFPVKLNFENVLDFAASECASWVVTSHNQLWKLSGYNRQLILMSGVTNVRCGDLFCVAWDINQKNSSHWYSTTSDDPPPSIILVGNTVDDFLVDVSIGQHHALLQFTRQIFAVGDHANSRLGNTQLPAKILDTSDGTVFVIASCGNYSAVLNDDYLQVFGNTTIENQQITGVKEISCAGPVLFLRQATTILTLGAEIPALHGTGPSYTDLGSIDTKTMPAFADFTTLARPSSTAEAMFALGSELNPFSFDGNHVFAWGANHAGQLGIGTKSYAELPIEVLLPKGAATSLLEPPVGSSNLSIYGSQTSSSFTTLLADTGIAVHSTKWFNDTREFDFFDFSAQGNLTTSGFALATTGTEWVVFRDLTMNAWREGGGQSRLVPGQYSFPRAEVSPGQVLLECGYSTCFFRKQNNLSSLYLWGDNSTGQLPPLSGASNQDYVSFNPDAAYTMDMSPFNIDNLGPVVISLARDYSVLYDGKALNPSLYFFGGHWFSNFEMCSFSANCRKTSSAVSAISSGYSHTLAIVGPAITTFGDKTYQPSADSGFVPPTGHRWTDVAAVQDASFALSSDGSSYSVWAWGRNTNQLLAGLGTQDVYSDLQQLSIPIPPGSMMSSAFLCTKCRGGSMFLAASIGFFRTRSPSAANSPVFTPPVNEPGRVSFGENQFGSLGVFSVRSPQLPMFMPDHLNPPLVSVQPNISVAHSRHGSLVLQGAQYLYWRSYNQENLLMPLLTTGYALSSSAHYGELNSDFGRLSAVSGGSKIFGVSADSLYEYDFNLTQWTISENISSLTNVFVSPAQEDADFSRRIPVTGSTQLFLNYTGSIVAYLTADGTLMLNGTAQPSYLPNVTSASIGYHILAAIRIDSSVWTHSLSGSSELVGHNEPGWGRVFFQQAGRIIQVQCAHQVTYALDHIGNVFAWGWAEHYGFGAYDMDYAKYPIGLDWIWNPQVVNASLQVVKISTDTWNDVHFWFGQRTVQTGTCDERPPSYQFACVNGVWSLFQPYFNSTLTIGGYVVVDSEINLGGNLIFDDINSWLNSSSCVNVNGSVIINLSDQDVQGLQSKGSPTLIQLISAMCGDVQGNIQLLYEHPCLDVQVQTIESSENGYTLNGLFTVNEKDSATGCKKNKSNTWWIILVSVLGGVVLLIIILALLVTFTPLKGVVRPFTKRVKEP